jgi:PTS system nitrogen regulatory IIA component
VSWVATSSQLAFKPRATLTGQTPAIEVEMATISMAYLLTPSRIIPQIRAGDKVTLLDALATRMAADSGLSKEALVAAAAVAADFPPLMLRGGVSLLHTLVAGLARPIAVFARLRNPLNLGGRGDCNTDLVAFLASPEDKPGDHLRALACLARRLRRSDVLTHLRATKSREVMHLILTNDEWCTSQAKTS